MRKGDAIKLTDDHLTTFEEDGFVVIENMYPEGQRAHLAAAMRSTLPPWEELKHDPPEGGRLARDFPYAEMIFNKFIVDADLIEFIQRILDTEDIHFRYAHNWARYPNQLANPLMHIDHGNNSLLPPCNDRRYGQVSTWYFPEAVADGEAPMRIVPKPYGKDESKAIFLVVPAGTLLIFNTHLWHSSTAFEADEGERYSVTRIYGRADHYWEGVSSYTSRGMKEDFRKFISTLTARERQYFRFPPAGHPYYGEETLAALEEQYPGWNARSEYI